ncbi:angiopoietin-related protein 3-like [Alosa sapidissima]|uniref:angiopoietin-related protein 3-like n=1 Tax=Alosa sapidissima TaxID=34773 RepID=UPI001C08A05B|nr:angiopoietin-related protein 3-like [Alosa sapidissima]XP_041914157.1 angiopoietin-related protein 3-like [Alosa sapidissima]
MKLLLLLLVFVACAHGLPATGAKEAESRFSFAPLDDVRLLANGLLQLGHSLKDFVQKTKGQINDIFQKLNVFDRSFYQLATLASEIKEEEEELKKTTVVLKSNNDEIKSLSQEINTKVEDIIRERSKLRSQVGQLEEKMSGLSQGLLSADQLAEISALKEVIHTQERSITDLLKAVREQSEQLNFQRTQIKSLEKKVSDSILQDTVFKWVWNKETHNVSGYLSDNSTSNDSLWDGLPAHCGDVYARGQKNSGLYPIKPNRSRPFLVHCEMTDNGGATVIQHRQDGSVDFDQTWRNYEEGFGSFKGEFWLGLRKVHALTQHNDTILRIIAEDSKQAKYVVEYHLMMEDASSDYAIHLRPTDSDLPTTVGNDTAIRFSTKDRMNDEHQEPSCTNDYTGGWWFSACSDINLNGRYTNGKPHGRADRRKGTHLKAHARSSFSLKSSQITIRHVSSTHIPPQGPAE